MRYVTGTGQVLQVHNKGECRGKHCPIHFPSNHCMRDFPTHWRDDRGIMERICPHGVGHPDPDQVMDKAEWVHGCDGCCSEEGFANLQANWGQSPRRRWWQFWK